jgi:DNA-binding HxlR family transcriptional regulator
VTGHGHGAEANPGVPRRSRVVGERWKILIFCRLFEGKNCFNETRRSITVVSQRMLT